MARNRAGKGGKRTPRNPAAVSGVGAGSARTDGGAGQPIRVPGGQAYGERQASIAQQQAAPLAAAGAAVPPPGDSGDVPSGVTPDAVDPFGIDVFGPTNRPNEPLTAGSMGPGQQAAPDSDMLLRVIYSKRPTPYLARLLRG